MSTERRSKHEVEEDHGAGPVKSVRGKRKKTWVIVAGLLFAVCVASVLAGLTVGYLIGSRQAAPAGPAESSEPAPTAAAPA